MSPETRVYHLPSGKNEISKKWIEGLRLYLKQVFSWEQILDIHDDVSPSNALWTGSPFIIVGGLEEAQIFIRKLSPESRRIFDDCAYYWILSDSDRYFPASDRVVTLDWRYEQFEVIASSLKLLLKYPRLAGLSRGMHKVRTDIERLVIGKKGPWSPVLILGESGTGKEEVAFSLYTSIDHKESGKDVEAFTPLACGSLDKELIRSQLFGIGARIATGVKERPGLLERGSRGCVFLDDCDTALELIQGPLLRVMSSSENQPAVFYRLGEENEEDKKCETMVWLIFSTNADIGELVQKKELREDFIFRFKDRIIHIPPLFERPADIPAIAHHIWNQLGAERGLSSLTLERMFTHKTKWKGNVRSLQALLSLAASMIHLPAHNEHSQRQIFSEIMSRGEEYYHWVGIIASSSFTGEIASGNPDVQAILKLDEGHHCVGLKRNQPAQPPTGSEREASSRLSLAGREAFERALSEVKSGRERSNVVRPSVRLARIVAFVARRGEIDRRVCVDLCSIGDVTAAGDLKLLEKAGLLRVKPRKENEQAENRSKHLQVNVYKKAPAMFN